MKCVASHAQGPGQKNPDVSFDLGPQDTPVKVTLGRQQALDGGVSDNPQVSLSQPSSEGSIGMQSNAPSPRPRADACDIWCIS